MLQAQGLNLHYGASHILRDVDVAADGQPLQILAVEAVVVAFGGGVLGVGLWLVGFPLVNLLGDDEAVHVRARYLPLYRSSAVERKLFITAIKNH